MSLENTIGQVEGLVAGFVDETNGLFPDLVSFLVTAPTHEDQTKLNERITTLKGQLHETISAFSSTKIDPQLAQGASDDTKAAVESFNGSIDQQARDFILLMGFTKYVDSKASELQQAVKETEEKTLKVQDVIVGATSLGLIAKLGLVLEAMMALANDARFASMKSGFYLVWQTIVDSLAALPAEVLGAFWYFVESRAQSMKSSVFNPEITLNRIAVLSLCNNLTDRLYTRQLLGHLDSYRKDSFNDTFQARVRVFLASLLNFDDLTGLNKYFTLANRANNEPSVDRIGGSDDQLLEDVLAFYRLLRDPYYYLRNPRQLASQADAIFKLHKYLVDEEIKYLKVHPLRNYCAIVEPVTEEQKHRSLLKYASKKFFPEHYWMSPFESDQTSAHYKQVKAEDQRLALQRFDSSKFRRLLIIQMYFISCFFLELQALRKREVLGKIAALATTKHITEDATPESLIPRFQKIKRDTIVRAKEWDSQWAFTLQHVSTSEENWWAWLIYGKLADGKPLLALRTLTSQELEETVLKFDAVMPEKTKRYFNSHCTPQLSRRMKTPTGIEMLVKKEPMKADHYREGIEELSRQIERESDQERKSALVEERTVLVWKQMRMLREEAWLGLDGRLDREYLEQEKGEGEDEEKGEEKGEDEKEGEHQGSETKEHGTNGGNHDHQENGDTAHSTAGLPKDAAKSAQSVGEIAGDHVAEAQVVNNLGPAAKSVGEVAGESVADTRKRTRSQSPGAGEGAGEGAGPAKKSRR